jgi:predicted PurR-regulated permease PerM
MNIRITIGIVAILVISWLFIDVTSHFIEPFLWALVIVLSTTPVYFNLKRRFSLSCNSSAFIMSSIIALSFIIVVIPILLQLAYEARELYVNRNSIDFEKFVLKIPYFGEEIAKLIKGNSIFDYLLQYRESIFNIISQWMKNIGNLIFNLCLAIFFTFFLYRDGQKFSEQLKKIFIHVAGDKALPLINTAVSTVKGTVYGTVFTAITQGIIAGIGYWITGCPTPVLLGFTTMIFSFIPFGAPLVYLPMSFYLVVISGQWFYGILLLIWGICLVSTADNILRPIFISQATEMSLLLIFISVLGGIFSFGLLGLFIGPVIVALVTSLWIGYLKEINQSG